jgi:hypothetical protein
VRKVLASRDRAEVTRRLERLMSHLKRTQPMNRSGRVQVKAARDKMMRNEVGRRVHRVRKVPASLVMGCQETRRALRVVSRRMGSPRTGNHKKVSRRKDNLRAKVNRKDQLRVSLVKANLLAVCNKATETSRNKVSRCRISQAAIEMVSVASRL